MELTKVLISPVVTEKSTKSQDSASFASTRFAANRKEGDMKDWLKDIVALLVVFAMLAIFAVLIMTY